MVPKPSVAILLLNWNSTGETLSCLAHLGRLQYPGDRLRIVVLDNGSRPEELEALRRGLDGSRGRAAGSAAAAAPGVELLTSPVNLGFTGGVNHCLQHLAGGAWDFFLLLNNDTEPPPELIATL